MIWSMPYLLKTGLACTNLPPTPHQTPNPTPTPATTTTTHHPHPHPHTPYPAHQTQAICQECQVHNQEGCLALIQRWR